VHIIAASDALRESAGVKVPWWVERWLNEATALLKERLGAVVFRDEWNKALQAPPFCVVDMAVAELGVDGAHVKPLPLRSSCPVQMGLRNRH
jgi:hypothetical protein